MPKFQILIALSCILLASCFPTRTLVLEDMSEELIQLPFRIDSLEVIDARAELLPMNWDMPAFYISGQEYLGNPVLSEKNKLDIEHIVRRSEKTDGVPVTMEYKVLEGFCSISPESPLPKESAKFKAEVLMTIPSRNMTYTSYAEMSFDYPTVNPNENEAMQMYNQAVKNATHSILKQIATELVVE